MWSHDAKKQICLKRRIWSCFRTWSKLTKEWLSVVFLWCYLGMGVPAIIAGYAVASGYGIFETAIMFAMLVMSLSFVAIYRMMSGGAKV